MRDGAKEEEFDPYWGCRLLQSCVVEVEPLKKRKYFTFSVIDEEDKTLALRVSTEDLADGERWVAAMESAGVARQASLPPVPELFLFQIPSPLLPLSTPPSQSLNLSAEFTGTSLHLHTGFP